MECSQISTMNFDTLGNDMLWKTAQILNFMSVTYCKIYKRIMPNNPLYKSCLAIHNLA